MANPIKGTIQDVEDPTKFINFYSFDPPGSGVDVNYEHQNVRGRRRPYRFYSDSGPETWEFNIHLVSSLEIGDTRTNLDVWKEHLFLKTFTEPDYGTSKARCVRPPHLMAIAWGQSINLVGAMISAPRFTWVPPYDENGYPFGIDVSFTLEVDDDLATPSYAIQQLGILNRALGGNQ